METVIRLCALCLTGALLAVLLKRTNPDIALLLAVAVCGAALLLLAEPLGQVRDLFTQLLDWGGLPTDLFLPLVKTVGIALVSRTGSDLCRDAGESAPWHHWWRQRGLSRPFWCHCRCFGRRGTC